MRIYLAGKIRGEAYFNVPAFRAADEKLRAEGHEVYDPMEETITEFGDAIWQTNVAGDEDIAIEHGFNRRLAMANNCEYLCLEALAIALLPGWEKSRGAKAERALAIALGLQIIYLDGATQ